MFCGVLFCGLFVLRKLIFADGGPNRKIFVVCECVVRPFVSLICL